MNRGNPESGQGSLISGGGALYILLAAVFLLYIRILGHEFITVWDDNYYVTGNPHAWGLSWSNLCGAFTSFYTGNYAPVQIVSYMLDYSVWELRPAGYLFTNLLLHLANGLLLFRLFMRRLDDRVAALAAAAFFLVHPVQVETVAWVSQRKTLLAVFFMLLSWEFYCRWQSGERRGRLVYCVSVAAFMLSLLSKSVTVVFPAVLLLYDASFPSVGRRFNLKDKLPYLLAAAAVAAVTFVAQQPDVGSGGRAGYHGGSPWTTLLSMLPVFCRYIGLLLWPAGLSADYTPAIHLVLDRTVVISFILLAAVAYGGWYLWKRDRSSGFWFLFFWLGLLPVSQLVPLVTMMNDRYLYLPLCGAAALFGFGVRALRQRSGPLPAPAVNGLAAALLAVLAAVTFVRAGVWRDSVTLFSDVVQKYPHSDRGWRLLADANREAGRDDEARRIFVEALAYNPRNEAALAGLGDLLNSVGRHEEARDVLQRLLQIDPRHASGWLAMGEALEGGGALPEAEQAYRQVLAIQPSAMPMYLKLGDLAARRGMFIEGRRYFDLLEQKEAAAGIAAYRRACLEALAGDQAAALAWLEKAFQRGYGDYDGVYSTPELQSLRQSPRFATLLDQYFPGRGGR